MSVALGLELPSLVQNYEFLNELGEGGMGQVWLARDKRLERLVAIKSLKMPEDIASQKSFVDRFLTEARAIARLSHPNIVSIYDFGEEAGQYYMIMEYLEGRPLSQLIDDFPRIPVPLCTAMGVQICSALEYIHKRGIIHRDIKPANILLSREGVAKLTDFGIVKLTGMHKGMGQIEDANTSLGTIKYSSPEQMLDAAKVDHTTDIYALGLTLYELLTEEHPFQASSVSEFISKIFEGNSPSLREIFWDIPETLDQIVSKSMSRHPEERYQSAAEMGHALSELVDSKSLQKVLVGPLFNLKASLAETSFPSSPVSAPVEATHTDLRLHADTRKQLQALRKDISWIDGLCLNLPYKESNHLPKARFLERVVVSGFSGIIQINHDVYALVQNGYFLDFVSHSITEKLQKTGEELFYIIPEQLEYIRLYLTAGDKLYLPLLIANILNERGQSTTETDANALSIAKLLSAEPDLTGYLMCKNANTLYCLGYSNGNQVFNLELNGNQSTVTDSSFEQILGRSHTLWDLYHAEVTLSPLNEQVLLRQSHVLPVFPAKPNLESLIEGSLSNQILDKSLQKTFKQGLVLNSQFKLDKPEDMTILNTRIGAAQIVNESLHHRFLHYWLTELALLIHNARQLAGFQRIYQSLRYIGECQFFRTYPGELSPLTLDICCYDREKPTHVLHCVKVTCGEEAEVEKLVRELSNLQQNYPEFQDLQGAFLISPGPFTPEALHAYARLLVTDTSQFGPLKGMVRSNANTGFQFCLLEYLQHEKRFNLITPSVYG